MRLLCLAAIAAVFLMRLHLSMTRAFDPDEFAYLHWTWLIANGYLPYSDFFFYIMPGFPWLLSPILWFTGDSTNFLIASRVFLFIVYGLSAAVVYRLSRGSLLAVLIFLAFPVTIDKTIDLRPDMVMLLLYFASVLVTNSLLSGLFFGLSFLSFPKIIFGLPALLFLRPPNAKWLAGAAGAGVAFAAYLGINNLMPHAVTALAKDSFAVTTGKQGFSPLLLFTPYPLIYLTQGGVSLPWAVNTAVWIAALAGLVMLYRTNKRMAIFWTIFIAGNVLFIILFPVPYVQYFLPLSVAASVLVGYAVRKNRTVITMIIMITVLSSFFLQYRQRIAPGAQNAEQLQVIRDVLAVTKPNESVYDMVGSFVFRPDGYFICCHPYGEFATKLTKPPPALAESLTRRQTKFLVMDRVGFVFWQTPEPDKSFLLTNYLPSSYPKLYSLGQTFRCELGACVQYNQNNQPAGSHSTTIFTIIASEQYTVTVMPSGETVTIDDQPVQNGRGIFLSTGVHRFTASPAARVLRIQLAR